MYVCLCTPRRPPASLLSPLSPFPKGPSKKRTDSGWRPTHTHIHTHTTHTKIFSFALPFLNVCLSVCMYVCHEHFSPLFLFLTLSYPLFHKKINTPPISVCMCVCVCMCMFSSLFSLVFFFFMSTKINRYVSLYSRYINV